MIVSPGMMPYGSDSVSTTRHIMTLKRHLPARVRAARERRGMTQKELARRAGVSRATIMAVEGGQCGRLRVQTLILLCQELGYSADYLLGMDKAEIPAELDTSVFPLSAIPGGILFQKCYACDSLLELGISHTLQACVFVNHERGKHPAWLAQFYSTNLEKIFFYLIEEQHRLHDRALMQ